ncbi:MAG: hypothetical protein ACRCV7_03695, partial [Culicoidibacterales bacterium]
MSRNSSIKRKLSLIPTLIVIFTMITSLFAANTISVAAMSTATATDDLASYTITTNANESQEYENMVYYKIDYHSLPTFSSGAQGQKVVITLPKNMDKNPVVKYEPNHFKLTETDNQIILTYIDSLLT